MWSFVMIVGTVLLWVMLVIGFIAAFVFGVLFSLALIDARVSIEEDKSKIDCEHINYHYSESHPEKVWQCNDCGENF